MSSEHERAIAFMESAMAHAEDAYFAARPDIDTRANRRIFSAGFERAYGQTVPDEPVQPVAAADTPALPAPRDDVALRACSHYMGTACIDGQECNTGDCGLRVAAWQLYVAENAGNQLRAQSWDYLPQAARDAYLARVQ